MNLAQGQCDSRLRAETDLIWDICLLLSAKQQFIHFNSSEEKDFSAKTESQLVAI